MGKRYASMRMTCISVSLLVVVACKKDTTMEIDNRKPLAFKLKVPLGFPEFISDADNPLTVEGVELGRQLFYDVRLSGSNKISCASCHQQNLAFADGVALNNIGESGRTLDRHSPALFNLAWSTTGLFWDGGSTNLESQAFAPITNVDEMNQDLLMLEKELKQVPDYVKQFRFVFDDEIKSTNVVKALAQFQRTLVSAGSRYDKYKRGDEVLTSVELAGMNLVNTRCKGCHSGELFTDNLFHNNGIDDSFSDAGEGIYQGRFRVTFNPADLGKFKTPSLRNVFLTAPYMHDGRFKSIDEVLDHYETGVKGSPTTDVLVHQNQGRPGIPTTKDERIAIKAFLATLTDNDFIKNTKISKPN